MYSAARLDIAAGKWHEVKAGLKKAKELCEEGGDWERKNRLKVGLRGAIALLLLEHFCECPAYISFDATTHMCSYTLFIMYIHIYIHIYIYMLLLPFSSMLLQCVC